MNIEAFFKITYGLYIISSKTDNQLNGYIANTAFQVTADPPQIAISCNKDNLTCQSIEHSSQFSISVLNQNASAETIGLFGYKSGRDINKFSGIKYINTKNGTPVVIEDTIAWFDCKVNHKLDVGTHVLFIATIIENDILEIDANPLTYAFYREVKKGSAPKNAPTYIDKTKFKPEPQDVTKRLEQKFKCVACGYVYDSVEGDIEHDILPGTPFEDLPAEWTCPVCGSPKSIFNPI